MGNHDSFAGDSAVRIDRLQVSDELDDAPKFSVPTTQAGLSEGEMRVLAWLRSYTAQIGAAEERFNIDRRAIAGAIAWEALENIHVRMWFSRYSGAGKVHYKRGFWEKSAPTVAQETEDAGYLPRQKTDDDRGKYLVNPTNSINYIAGIMRGGADAAEENGYMISDQPDILTEYYVGFNLDRWKAHLAAKPKGAPILAREKMPMWVMRKLPYLTNAVGQSRVKQICTDVRSPPKPSPCPVNQHAAGPTIVTIEHGESLSSLAQKHYGSWTFWPLLWDANRSAVGPNPNRVKAKTPLTLPNFSSFGSAQREDAKRRSPSWKTFR